MSRVARFPLAALAVAVTVLLGALPAGAQYPAGWEIPDEPIGRMAGTTPISQVNANTAGGFSPLEFFQVTVQGVVVLGTGRLDPFDVANPSAWAYVDDGTGAVAIAASGSVPFALAAGESVQVTGTVTTQGTSSISGTRTLAVGGPGSGVVRLGTASPPAPVVLTATDVFTNGAAFEGSLARVNGLTLVAPSEWPAPGASAFVRVTDGSTTFRMRVDDDTDLDSASPPAASFDLVGFVAQDDPSPFNDNHYLYPRGSSDIVVGDGSGTVTVTPAFVPESATGVSLAFTIQGQTVTLATVELDIATNWTWTGSGSDVTLSGPGFAGALATVVPGVPTTVQITGASVTSSSAGTLTIANLDAALSPELSTFPVRTATSAGTPTPVSTPPVVNVVTGASPGDVVINELYPVTGPGSSSREGGEFIELYNRTAMSLDISGWGLQDIGLTPGCTLGPRWAFPPGTIIAANGYVVVCRTALDPGNPATPNDDVGFRIEFPSLPPGVPLLEMYDPESNVALGDFPVRSDDPTVPNLVLSGGRAGRDDQIALLGGTITNAGQCESPNIPGRFVPYAELVVLTDVVGTAIDAFEYREIGPCEGDLCTGPYTGPDDAYPYGPPKSRHSLGRDPLSTDTNSSRADVLPASTVTPGAANVPGDTVGPGILGGTVRALSANLLEIRFDEAVDEATAIDPANYWVGGPAGEDYVVHEILPDPEEPQRHYLVSTDDIPAASSARLFIDGVTDLGIGGPPNALATSAPFSVPGEALSICRIQDFDENGFSPEVGRTVVVAGYVTFGDVPQTPTGSAVPTDRISIWVQEPGGCGVNVFAFLPSAPGEFDTEYPDVREFGIRLNHLVRVRGVVTEFVSGTSGSGAVTEIAGLDGDVGFYEFILPAATGPEPVEVTTAGANDEALEGTLVHTQGTVINSNSLAAWIDDGTGATQIFQNFSSLDLTRFTVGDRVDVTGVITQFDSTEPYFSGYELVPQNQAAVFKVEGEFAAGGPVVVVERAVLVPDLGETLEIRTRSPRRSEMIVEIFDATGRKITTLYDGVGLGEMVFEWNGTGQDGSVVEPGVYLCNARSVALDGGSVETASAPIVVGLRLDGGGPR